MYAEEVMKLTEEQLVEQLRLSSSPGAMDYELCERELNRRYLLRVEAAVDRVDTTSKRLERLTWALIVLTLALALLAAPPAWDAVGKLLGK
jgi:hypothetical protein